MHLKMHVRGSTGIPARENRNELALTIGIGQLVTTQISRAYFRTIA